jgi:hypothetical protein
MIGRAAQIRPANRFERARYQPVERRLKLTRALLEVMLLKTRGS